MNLAGYDAMLPAKELGSWEWVTDAKYPFWRHLNEFEVALRILEAMGMVPEVTQEELPA